MDGSGWALAFSVQMFALLPAKRNPHRLRPAQGDRVQKIDASPVKASAIT
jgi:hypothetical protein